MECLLSFHRLFYVAFPFDLPGTSLRSAARSQKQVAALVEEEVVKLVAKRAAGTLTPFELACILNTLISSWPMEADYARRHSLRVRGHDHPCGDKGRAGGRGRCGGAPSGWSHVAAAADSAIGGYGDAAPARAHPADASGGQGARHPLWVQSGAGAAAELRHSDTTTSTEASGVAPSTTFVPLDASRGAAGQ